YSPLFRVARAASRSPSTALGTTLALRELRRCNLRTALRQQYVGKRGNVADDRCRRWLDACRACTVGDGGQVPGDNPLLRRCARLNHRGGSPSVEPTLDEPAAHLG